MASDGSTEKKTQETSVDESQGCDTDHTSQAARELLKFDVVEKALDYYRDVVGCSEFTRGVADAVESRQSAVCRIFFKTKAGQFADQMIAQVALRARRTVNVCFLCKWDRESECTHSALTRIMMSMFHVYFRFFLPFLFMRWSVDIALLVSETILAFFTDLVRKGPQLQGTPESPEKIGRPQAKVSPRRSPGKQGGSRRDSSKRSRGGGEASESNKQAPGTPKGKKQRKDDDGTAATTKATPTTLQADRNQGSRSLLDRIEIIIYLIFLTTLRTVVGLISFFIVEFIIPCLKFQVVVLSKVSDILHRLAGLDEYYNVGDTWRRNFIYKNLINKEPDYPVKRKLGRREWLMDFVIDRGFGDLQTFPIVLTIVQLIGIKRPLKILYGLSDIVISLRKKEHTLVVPYLQDDPSYDESEDPDYVPEEHSSDADSLEYREDEELDVDGDNQETDYESCNEPSPKNGTPQSTRIKHQEEDSDSDTKRKEPPVSEVTMSDAGSQNVDGDADESSEMARQRKMAAKDKTLKAQAVAKKESESQTEEYYRDGQMETVATKSYTVQTTETERKQQNLLDQDGESVAATSEDTQPILSKPVDPIVIREWSVGIDAGESKSTGELAASDKCTMPEWYKNSNGRLFLGLGGTGLEFKIIEKNPTDSLEEQRSFSTDYSFEDAIKNAAAEVQDETENKTNVDQLAHSDILLKSPETKSDEYNRSTDVDTVEGETGP